MRQNNRSKFFNRRKTRKMPKAFSKLNEEATRVLYKELNKFLAGKTKYSLEEVRKSILGFLDIIELNGGLTETQRKLADIIRDKALSISFSEKEVREILNDCGGFELENF